MAVKHGGLVKRRDFLKATGATTISAGLLNNLQGKQAVHPGEDGMQSKQIIEWTRKVPIRYTADVAVIGGGIAGVSAACAAAKSGARVILVERFAVTGGMLTTGGVANFCGQMSGQGEVFDQIVT